jgi:hypothetical protein
MRRFSNVKCWSGPNITDAETISIPWYAKFIPSFRPRSPGSIRFAEGADADVCNFRSSWQIECV